MKILFIISGTALIVILFLFLLCGYIYNHIAWFKTWKLPKFISERIAGNQMPDEYEVKARLAEKKLLEYPLEELTVKTQDGYMLKGSLLEPKISNGKLIIACHGARSSGTGEFSFIAPYLYKQGYTLFMPEHRGCGKSDGKFMGYGTHESKDTYLWFEILKKRFPGMSFFLYGVSMGAATVLMMSPCAADPLLKGIVADCSYTSAWDEFSYHLKTSFHLPDFPLLYITDLYSRVIAGYSFKDASPLEAVKKSVKPVLFIHGDRDDFVPFYMRDVLYNACPRFKMRLTVKGAVHARSYYCSPGEYRETMESFIDKCMNGTYADSDT